MRTVRMVLAGLLVGSLFASCGTRTQTTDDDVGQDAVSTWDGLAEDAALPGDADEADITSDSLTDDITTPDIIIDPGDIPPHTPAPLAVHACKELPQLAEGDCAKVDGTNDYLLLQGIVLGVQDVWVGGDVLIDPWGIIVCAGCDCSGEAAAADATVITCPEGIVSPGLINAHEHLTYSDGHPDPSIWGEERYEHRHHWRCGKAGHKKIPYDGGANKEEITWVEMRMLMSGVTSIAGSGSADGFVRNLDKAAQEGLNQPQVEYETFPLGDGNCTMLDEGCDYPTVPGSWVGNTDCYLPHVSEGINLAARNEFLCLSSEENGGVDVTNNNSAFVHSIGLNARDGEEMAYSGAAVIWSPRSNISLYGNTAQAPMYNRLGVLMGIGTDWSYSGSMNMQRELQCAAFLNDNYYGGYFSDHELWLMATAGNALALAVSDVVGAIWSGRVADIAIYRGDGSDNYHRAVIDGSVAETLLVLRSGVPLYGATDLVTGLAETEGDKCEPVTGDVCGEARTICAKRETGSTFAQLVAANAKSYDLFFCGDPTNEVTCVPSRNEPVGGKYSGQITADDADGDGIANSQDNCPAIFNPSRPMDDGQPDWDKDGLGDACDPCPIDGATLDCGPPNPFDGDGDEVLDLVDNCPGTENSDQADSDGDQVGDACDACPDLPNPFGAACPGTIYDIKLGNLKEGAVVEVTGVVTAFIDGSYWLQVPEEMHDSELGYQFSGIYVYKGSGGDLPDVQLGDYLAVTGEVDLWWGQLELTWITDVEIIEAGMALPTPVAQTPEKLGTDGELAEEYEGVLCIVQGAQVTELNPPAGSGDNDPTNEYVLDDALRVNDLFYSTEPFPEVGQMMTVVGILRWANGDSKLEPRGADDIIPELALAGFNHALVFVNQGATQVTTTPELVIALNTWAPEGGVAVALESSEPDHLGVPAVVTVPAGELGVSVPVTPTAAGDDAYTVTATYDGQSVQTSVMVLGADAKPAPKVATPEPIQVSIDGTTAVTVTLDIPGRPGGTTVSLTTLPTGLMAVPESVVVPENEFSATFEVIGLAEGNGKLILATQAGDLEVAFGVLDVPLLGLVLSEIFYNPPGSDTGKEWVELYNGTASPIDLSGYSLGNGGGDYTTSVVQLSGTLEPGQCYVVGGPTADADNGFPEYNLAVDFDPDFQNSGDKADAIALFAVPAAQIKASTVPIDAVIYGGENVNGLMDETGAANEPEIGNVSSGSSAEKRPEGWLAQPIPSPNDCSHLWMPAK
jgi:cytosine/adenosine deaminase-related metal-dependent hydrolase